MLKIQNRHSTKASRATDRKHRKPRGKRVLKNNTEPTQPVIKPQSHNMVVTPLFAPLPYEMNLDDNFTLDEYKPYEEKGSYIMNYEENDEIRKFVDSFNTFQWENNIGIVSDSMNPEKWIEVDTFIFRYIYKLSCENKIKKIIYEYGIAKGLVRLFEFYKKDLCIGILQKDCEIMEYISNQCDNSINTDMALAILRESIGFSSYRGIICD